MMKRATIPMALLALGISSLGVAHAEIVADFPEVVIFGQSSVQIDQNVTVFSGDVVANSAVGTMSLGNKVTTPAGWEVKANTLSVGNFVNLNGAEFCNIAVGGVVCAMLTPLPVYDLLPVFQPGSAGGPPVMVPNSGSTVLTPGDYGALTVGVEGTVTFQGPGDFNFTSFSAGRKGQFVFTGGPIEIRVTGNFSTGVEDNINLANSPVDASDIAIYVGGNAELGAKTNVNANFYVQGLLELGSNVIARGAYLANQIVIGQKSQFTLSTFWDFQPCQTEAPGACDDSAETQEDTAVTVDVLANDTDFEVDDLFVNSVTQGANGSVTFTAGDVTYTPNADYFGPDSFTYEVCDEDTKINEDNCTDNTVSITVISVNDPPVTAADSLTIPEDSPVQTIDVLANDTAGPANELQTLDLAAVTGSGNSHVKIVANQVEYTPNANYFGTDTFDYTACDQGDGADDPTVLCTVETVTVTVTPVNDPPEADPQDVNTSGNVNLVITLTGADVDGDTLAFTITAFPNAAVGSIVAGPTQLTPTSASVTYDPANDQNEENSFTFQVDDGNGGTASAEVRINPPGDPTDPPDDPTTVIVAEDKSLELASGGSATIVLRAAAPVAPQPEAIGDLSFSITSGAPSLGIISSGPTPSGASPIRSATIVYDHTGANGTETITFDACEAADLSNCDSGTITIEISDFTPPPAPVANDISVTTGVGNSVVIDLTGGAPPSEAPDGRVCTDNSDCASGFVCVDGACEPAP